MPSIDNTVAWNFGSHVYKFDCYKNKAEQNEQQKELKKPDLVDNLYHLGLDTVDNNLTKTFSDIKFVCMMGSMGRAKSFAEVCLNELRIPSSPNDKNTLPDGSIQQLGTPFNHSHTTDRCVLYKVGPVLSISHGMGSPSCLIFLHEVAKLIYHSGIRGEALKSVLFIRLGTSGGVGVEAGTVCLTDKAVDACLEFGYEHVALGQKKRYQAVGCPTINNEIKSCWERQQQRDESLKNIPISIGHTMATDDYYEGQGRLDGALPEWYTEQDRMNFLQKARDMGLVNIEMESTVFLFFFNRLGATAVIVNAALLDRLEGDQHSHTHAKIAEFASRPQKVVGAYLKEKILGY